MKRAVKACVVGLLVVGIGSALAEENAVMESIQQTQVCKLISFMAQVKDNDHKQECMEVRKGARALLAGMLQAGGTFYLLVDGDYQWWVGDTSHWRVTKGEEQ